MNKIENKMKKLLQIMRIINNKYLKTLTVINIKKSIKIMTSITFSRNKNISKIYIYLKYFLKSKMSCENSLKC